MKLGLVDGLPNKVYAEGEPFDLEIGSSPTGWRSQIRKFYPDEKFYTINLFEPDLDLAKKIDLLFITSENANPPILISYIYDIKCRTIIHIPDGYYSLYRSPWGNCLRRRAILDASDFVISMDHENIEVLRMFTRAKVFWWPLPYPIDDISLGLEGEDVDSYDIVIPYGPSQSRNTDRNGYFMALLAGRMVREIDGFDNIGIFNWCPVNGVSVSRATGFMKKLGCENFTILPQITHSHAIKILAQAKLLLFMDSTRAAGRWAIESAVLKVPTIFSDTIPQARYIYGEYGRVSPFDAEGAMKLARQIACGETSPEELASAKERASYFSIENARSILEKETQ